MLTIDESEVSEGQMREYKMDDKSVLVARVNGKFYAIGNKCTHRGCLLTTGVLEGLIVTCRCHGTKFDVSNGKVVAYVTKMSKIAAKLASFAIKDAETYDVKVVDSKVQISGKAL
ncbi:MAG: Rieske (2Fe-2S) protein [Actinobacteria bacterium]|nr:Rieske (2Fe-2S) protein [Actinomycetota bacterium]